MCMLHFIGASEEVIGEALKELFADQSFTREQLFLISKAGYLQRSDISILDPSEYVQINDKHFHSLAPALLEAQITGSLKRMGIDRLDLFMLNSPERMMLANNKQFTKADIYKSIHLALRHLDHEVSRGYFIPFLLTTTHAKDTPSLFKPTPGRISSYGVCSNSMANPGAPDHISLSQILDDLGHSAENFAAVESPFNLFERGVVSGGEGTDVTGMEMPLAKLAAERGVYLFINRPLTAIAGGQIRALVNPSTAEPAVSEQELLDKLTKDFENTAVLEANISAMRAMIANTKRSRPLLTCSSYSTANPFHKICVLAENFSALSQNHFAAKHYIQQQLEPAVRRDLEALEEYAAQLSVEDEKEEYRQWIKEYEKHIHTLTTHLTTYTRIDHYRKSSDLDRVLCAVCPPLAHTPSTPHSPLSVKSLRVLLANQEVGTVLVGMRARAYVADALLAARMESEKTLEREAVEDVFACPLLL
ncbi:hypothetical protein BC937DRAFT_92277 [Endogone sp. FLAS-F59071]|nr:hypothetical protein BC937DRAFT_92277 [Endogone sp. FLAS-F59071]|eukprot:RUS15571.1 hypothetical protein BC937DRAFT_92277 [Endogone sp. FLAS-F59071]